MNNRIRPRSQKFRFADVLVSLKKERIYQENKFPDHSHSVGEWILIMEKCLNDAKRNWMESDQAALHEIRQVTAVGIAAMQQCGIYNRGGK